MRKVADFIFPLIVLLILGSVGCAAPAKMAVGDVPRMPADELNAHLGDPALVVIDVRQAADWEASPVKIKGATREDYRDVSGWASNYPKDKTIVLYCA